ncbi:hypothetical protein B0H16DRAFT_1466077 [Mycena metata]|uniref:Uncharacterized protein n=1 Tax=Mycena metata TaxID=1033252 RepID=A0AAD7IAV7_9AGAR|nr:hypothetical protein B0H16DRAFT_1466077 [Mycena metata]
MTIACGTGRGGGLVLLRDPLRLARVVRVGPPAGVAANTIKYTSNQSKDRHARLTLLRQMRARRPTATATATRLGMGTRAAEARGAGHAVAPCPAAPRRRGRRVRVIAHAAVQRGQRRVEVVWLRLVSVTPVRAAASVVVVVVRGGGRGEGKVAGEGGGGGGRGRVLVLVRRADIKYVVRVRRGSVPVPAVAAGRRAIVVVVVPNGTLRVGAPLAALANQTSELVVKVADAGVAHAAKDIAAVVSVEGRGGVGAGGRGREMETLLPHVGLVLRECRRH